MQPANPTAQIAEETRTKISMPMTQPLSGPQKPGKLQARETETQKGQSQNFNTDHGGLPKACSVVGKIGEPRPARCVARHKIVVCCRAFPPLSRLARRPRPELTSVGAVPPTAHVNLGDHMTDAAKKSVPLRAVALSVAFAGTLFWLYTFYGIAQVPVGDGSGFQWVAVIPLGLIFVVFTLPALVCGWKGHFLWVALVLGCAGFIAFGLLWKELLSEFYHGA